MGAWRGASENYKGPDCQRRRPSRGPISYLAVLYSIRALVMNATTALSLSFGSASRQGLREVEEGRGGAGSLKVDILE